jgi:hypothetical protein
MRRARQRKVTHQLPQLKSAGDAGLTRLAAAARAAAGVDVAVAPEREFDARQAEMLRCLYLLLMLHWCEWGSRRRRHSRAKRRRAMTRKTKPPPPQKRPHRPATKRRRRQPELQRLERRRLQQARREWKKKQLKAPPTRSEWATQPLPRSQQKDR